MITSISKGIQYNGKPGNTRRFRLHDGLGGLKIGNEISDTSNEKLGAAEADLPPSAKDVDPLPLSEKENR